jgi:hypothetical protein
MVTDRTQTKKLPWSVLVKLDGPDGPFGAYCFPDRESAEGFKSDILRLARERGSQVIVGGPVRTEAPAT